MEDLLDLGELVLELNAMNGAPSRVCYCVQEECFACPVAAIQTICEALDSLAADAKLKGEIPQVVVIAACQDYITDIPEDLREPGRFTGDIYLPLPDVEGRKEILASFNLHVEPKIEQDLIHHLAEKTHAYNGKDLRRLVDTAQDLGRIRQGVHNSSELQINGEPTSSSPQSTLYYTPQDYTSGFSVESLTARRRDFLTESWPPMSDQRMGGGLRLMSCIALGRTMRRAEV